MKTRLSLFCQVLLRRKILFLGRSLYLILLLQLGLPARTFAQNIIWDKTFGGDGWDELSIVQQTSDGGYILGGTSTSGISGDKSEASIGGVHFGTPTTDFWVVKLKADGSKEWDKTYGGDIDDNLRSLQQTCDGGYILGGTFQKCDGDFCPTYYWIVKLKVDGSKEWDKTFGSDWFDELASLQQTSDGGYILGGSSWSGKSGDKSEDSKGDSYYDYWILKLKADGSKEWDKTFGGNYDDILASVRQTNDGGYILGGNSNSPKSGDKSEVNKGDYEDDYWVVKLKADGSKAWDKTFGGNGDDNLRSLQQTSDGGYILGGTSWSNISGDKTQASRGIDDYWIVKLQADGTKIWDKTFGGSNNDQLSALQQTSDGGYILGGTSSSDVSKNKTVGCRAGDINGYCHEDYWIVKIDAQGKIEWDKTIGGSEPDAFRFVQQTSDGGYILGGSSESGKSWDKTQANKGGTDYWLVKIDNTKGRKNQVITLPPIPNQSLGQAPSTPAATTTSGLPVSFKVVLGPATITGNKITLTGLGEVTVKAFVAANDTYRYAEAINSFFVESPAVVKKEWDKTIGGDKNDYISLVRPTRDGGYILGGSSASGISGDKSQDSKGGYDYWVVKLHADRTKAWDKTFGGDKDDQLTSLQQTSDGGYILGGSSSSGISGDKTEELRDEFSNDDYNVQGDYWIVKLKPDGTVAWDKTIGGNRTDQLASIEQTQDGGYILGGTSSSDISGDKTEAFKDNNFDSDWFNGDYWVVKLSAAGLKEWDKTIGSNDYDFLRSVQQTSDGGYLLGGSSWSGKSGDKTQSNKGWTDYWIVKLKANGTKAWDKTIGGNEDDYLSSLQQTSDGGYILGGYSYSGMGGDKSEENKGGEYGEGWPLNDYWIVKLKADGSIVWDKTIGGNGRDNLRFIQQTSDGGYIAVGSSDTGINGDKTKASGGDWLVKLQNNGTKVWDELIVNAHVTSLQQTSDNAYLFGCSSSSDIGGYKSEGNKGESDYWIVKLKEEQPLTAQWDMRYGGSGKDNFTNVIKTSDGGYLSGGYSTSGVSGDKSQVSQGQNDYWIVKSDKNGQKLWDKRFGGTEDDYLNRIIQTQDGGYLLAGSSLSGKSGDKTEANQGERDYWLVKVDKQGNKEWDKTFGGSGSEELKKVVQLASGDYVLGGSSSSPGSGDKSQNSQGRLDYWLVKIKADGTKLWDHRYGGSQEEVLGSFTETRDGGFFLGGSSSSGKSGDKTQANKGGQDYWALKTDKDGNLLWEKTYGGSEQDEVYSVGRSHGDYLFVAGTSSSGKTGDKSQNTQGGKDYWLVKLDENGNKLWDKSFGGSQDDELRASTFTEQGHYILAGNSYSQISGDKTQNSQGSSDYWVVEVAPRGDKIADQRYGGRGAEELRTVFQTPDDGLLLGGRSDSGVSGDRTQPSQGSTDYWLVKVAPVTSSIIAARTGIVVEEPATEIKLLQAFPNPFRGKVQVSFTLTETQLTTVKIYDSQGRETATLFQGEAQANQTYQIEWSAKNQSSGMYLLQLQTPSNRCQQKLLLAR